MCYSYCPYTVSSGNRGVDFKRTKLICFFGRPKDVSIVFQSVKMQHVLGSAIHCLSTATGIPMVCVCVCGCVCTHCCNTTHRFDQSVHFFENSQ